MRFLHTFQLYDFVDTLAERPVPNPVANGQRLHQARNHDRAHRQIRPRFLATIRGA